MKQRPRVLVTDAEARSVLAVCRGLAAAGYSVSTVADERCAPGHWSRFSKERITMPGAQVDSEDYVRRLSEVVRRGSYDMVIPGTERSLLPISEHRALIEPHARLGLPPHEDVLRALDKPLLQEQADAVGLAAPRSVVCSSTDEALAAAVGHAFPLVVKPTCSVVSSDGGLSQRKARVVREPAHLEAAVTAVGVPFMLQEYVSGPTIVSCAGVRVEGRLLGFTLARYARTYPSEVGSAALARTIAPAPSLVRQVEDLLERIGWRGMFELELLELGHDRFGAIDLNPRPFGWLALAIGAGANLPALWCDHVLGRPSVDPSGARVGVNYRWEDGDLANALSQLRSRRLRSAAAVLRPHRHVVHAHFQADDPAPLVARMFSIAKEVQQTKTSAPVEESLGTQRPLTARSAAPVAMVTTTIPRTMGLFHRDLIRHLKERGYDVCVVSSEDSWLHRIGNDEDVRVHVLNMARDISLAADFLALVRWLGVMRRERPALVVSNTPKASLLSQLAARVCRVPRRLYLSGCLRVEGVEGRRATVLSLMEKVTCWASSEVVVNSTSLRNRYLELGLARAGKLRQTWPGSSHGVDAQRFKPQAPDARLAAQVGLGNGIPVIGFVGRLTRDKGIDTLLEALSLLRADGTDVQLLVVGPQDGEPDSAVYIERLRSTGSHVVTVDWVEDVRPYFALMDIHVLPSIREGFPNVVLEASAMGIPTVTTDATGAVDSVRHGKTGLVVETGDAEALATAVRSLLSDAETAQRYGEAAREWVSSSFHPQQVVRSLLALPEDDRHGGAERAAGGVPDEFVRCAAQESVPT